MSWPDCPLLVGALVANLFRRPLQAFVAKVPQHRAISAVGGGGRRRTLVVAVKLYPVRWVGS